jgi:transcriptional regulator with XRE-family HTH domain
MFTVANTSDSIRLGRELASARAEAGRSLREIAGRAGISAAYLQKLERGLVAEPSPKVLRQLANALELDYAMLMRLVGYEMPATAQPAHPLQVRLAAADLTSAEQRAVAAFVEHLVAQRPSR